MKPAQGKDLVDSVDPDVVMRKLLAAFVELEPVWEAAYYISPTTTACIRR